MGKRIYFELAGGSSYLDSAVYTEAKVELVLLPSSAAPFVISRISSGTEKAVMKKRT